MKKIGAILASGTLATGVLASSLVACGGSSSTVVVHHPRVVYPTATQLLHTHGGVPSNADIIQLPIQQFISSLPSKDLVAINAAGLDTRGSQIAVTTQGSNDIVAVTGFNSDTNRKWYTVESSDLGTDVILYHGDDGIVVSATNDDSSTPSAPSTPS